MKKLNQLLTLAVALAALTLSRQKAVAQPGPGSVNFDPQQMQQQFQQRMMESIRGQLVVTNDDEWKVIEPRLTKVVQVRMESMLGGLGGMRGMMGGRGGNGGGGPPGGGRGFAGFGQPNPELEALQKVIEDKAPTEQVKAALAKLREARKQKEAELAKARAQLREVLSLRQEAVLVSMGMLE